MKNNITGNDAFFSTMFGETEESLREQAENAVRRLVDESHGYKFSYSTTLAEIAATARKDFIYKVLLAHDLELCISNLIGIIGMFRDNPELVRYCSASKLASLLKMKLLHKMPDAAEKGEIPDILMFLYRYLERYMNIIDVQKERMYFTEPSHVYAAKQSKNPPLPPIPDLEMFECVLGDSGLGAFILTYGQDVQHVQIGVALLQFADDKLAVAAILNEQLTSACLYDLYTYSLTGGKLPDWLQMKCSFLNKLFDTESEDIEEFLSGRTLFNTLPEDDEQE